ncbi:oxidoreductase [soil metagenome]
MKNIKTWLITGVAGGLGRALLEEVCKNGDTAYGTVRNANQVEEINAIAPGKSFGILMDLHDPAAILNAVKIACGVNNKLDVLVNNAGFGYFGSIEEASMEEARDQMETNFFGALAMTKAVIPIFRKQQSGHLLQISSSAGFRATAGFGIYNASKFALEGFSEALAQEMAPFNVRVTLVEPGPFRTSFAGGSSKSTALQMDEYEATAGTFRKAMNARNGNQPGDPSKAAKVMIAAVNSNHPPLRLPLGKPAFDAIRGKMKSVEQDLEIWEEMGTNTDFE